MTYDKQSGRFRVLVHEHKGEAALSITFILGPKGRGFTWHLRYKDLGPLRRLLGEAGPPLEQLHLSLSQKRKLP